MHIYKVRIFWEGHKIWKNLPLKICCYWVLSNFKWKIFSNFGAFSEYHNFNCEISKFHRDKNTPSEISWSFLWALDLLFNQLSSAFFANILHLCLHFEINSFLNCNAQQQVYSHPINLRYLTRSIKILYRVTSMYWYDFRRSLWGHGLIKKSLY